MQVTAQQIKNLWVHGGTIDRGDTYPPITQDDLGVLDIDTDDDGLPLDDQWQVIADQLNTAVAGEPASTAGDILLQEIADARIRRDRLKAAADEEFTTVIRAAVASRKAPVSAIAEAADLSRARIYQIRDGRR